jgi:hypothetical protein
MTGDLMWGVTMEITFQKFFGLLLLVLLKRNRIKVKTLKQ